MSSRFNPAFAVLGALCLAACKDSSPVSHSPTHLIIVSGANQSGDISAALPLPLVVQVLDGADRSVAGVPVTWNVTGGGSVTPPTGTSDNDGKVTATWTLSPTVGAQVATATSAQITTGAASFLANNGATISGTVTPGGGSPFLANLSLAPSRSMTPSQRTTTRHPSSNRIIVGFRNDVLGVAPVASSAYRSMSVARQTQSRLQASVAALSQSHPVSHAEVSPAMLAARLKVDDTLQIDAVMASLRADPSVAWVERDGIISIRDGAPHSMAVTRPSTAPVEPAGVSASVVGRVPNDPYYYLQSWPANMLDLPRAWSITTGSSNVIVAVVDMGIRFDHPNIAANLTNDGYDFVSETTTADLGYGTSAPLCDGGSFTSIDGDGDGPDADPIDPDDLEFVDAFGNFSNDFDDVNSCWQHNTLGDHGLSTASIIGAVGNQGHGAAGVNWNVRIRPIRALGITGDGMFFDIAQGVLYAAGLPALGANGAMVQTTRAQIINLSLGGDFPSNALQVAVNSAFAAGSLVVASAGNEGQDAPVYPAAFPTVLAVAAVGMDGTLATYSTAGTFVGVAAPGGDFRGEFPGNGILVPGWDFENGVPTYLWFWGTSASAPYVSGIAALLLAQTPGLTPAQLTQRIEQFATRPPGATRSDALGWGVANAYNSLLQSATGAPKATYVRLVDATTGTVARTTAVAANGTFAFTRMTAGAYYVQAGDDENGDGIIGAPGRRFAWAGGSGAPTIFNVNANALTTQIALGMPVEVEPNDDVGHANLLSVGSYVVGTITPPDTRDVYSVTISTPGVYTFETSGLVGACGYGLELDTFLSVSSASGTVVGTNNDFTSTTALNCSHVVATLTAGIYYVTVTSPVSSSLSTHGRYRLEVRAGT